MKLISLFVALVAPWVFAPGAVPPQDPPICNSCVDIGGGWTDTPQDCRSVTDTLSCTTVASGCSVSGSLTVTQICSEDHCLYMASVTDAPPGCGLPGVATYLNPTPPNTYSPSGSAQLIACQSYPGCTRVVGVHFVPDGTNCSLASINATYSHPFQCQ